MHKITPWHDEEEAQTKEKRVAALQKRAERAERVTYKLIASYHKTDAVISQGAPRR